MTTNQVLLAVIVGQQAIIAALIKQLRDELRQAAERVRADLLTNRELQANRRSRASDS